MSVILGKFNYKGEPLNPETIPCLMEHINSWEADDTGIWQNKIAGFGNRVIYNTPESIGKQQPYIDNNSGDVITADVRLDNREELYKKLSISLGQQTSITDTLLLLKAYQKWGKDCPQHLMGAFAFAIWDKQQQQLFCARDHIGCKPFFYSFNSNYFAFSSEVKALTAIPDFSWNISKIYLENLFTHIYADRATLYEDINILIPGHFVIVNYQGMQINKYWQFDPDKKIKCSSDKEYVEQFKSLLNNAINCRMRSAYPIGCQLSGGLDSSGIAALGWKIAKKQNKKFITYSNEMPSDKRKNQFYFRDESDRINELISYAGITHYRKITKPKKKFTEEIDYALNLQSAPPSVMFYYSDRIGSYAQEDGIRTVLSGFVGDEGVTTRCPGYLYYYLQQGQWDSLWRELNSLSGNVLKSSASIALKYLKFKGIPSNLTGRFAEKKWTKKTILHPVFQDKWNKVMMGKMKQKHHLNIFSNQLLIQKITNHHVENRIQSETLASNPYKIESRYPLADIRLLEFFMATPLTQKIYHGKNRLLFRRALEGGIPDTIRLIKKNDNRAVVIPYLFLHRMEEFEQVEALLSSSSKNPSLKFINFNFLLTAWRNMQIIFSENFNGQQSYLSPGKVLTGLQVICLMNKYPIIGENILKRL